MFAGKVIAITGASEGIGAELARQMAGKGVWLALAPRAALLRRAVVWRQSLFAGFMSAFASQLWFLGFSLTAAANVRTLVADAAAGHAPVAVPTKALLMFTTPAPTPVMIESAATPVPLMT